MALCAVPQGLGIGFLLRRAAELEQHDPSHWSVRVYDGRGQTVNERLT
jgi:hypothetical protein